MNNLKKWENNVRKITPYVPGIQPEGNDIIKLNTNENPYPPSNNAKSVFDRFDIEKLRLYPSFECRELKNILSERYEIKQEQLFLGNGSDEVLALCFQTFFNSDKPVLFPDITYSFYDVWCDMYNIQYNKIPLDENFNIRKEDYNRKNGGIIIANPNAPTGICLPLEDIEYIVSSNKDSIVIIDEAYIDFGGNSAIKLIEKYDNLVVVHTFSKSRSLAGIRIGYAAMCEDLIGYLEAVKNSFNSYTINSISQIAAAECAKDENYFQECCNKIINTRKWTVNELEKLNFYVLPSKANFIFVKHNKIYAKKLYDYLLKEKIYVRYFNKPRIDNFLRITIGTDEQMVTLINLLK